MTRRNQFKHGDGFPIVSLAFMRQSTVWKEAVENRFIAYVLVYPLILASFSLHPLAAILLHRPPSRTSLFMRITGSLPSNRSPATARAAAGPCYFPQSWTRLPPRLLDAD
ncbi:unnamed protein product, partial [Dibothriocephalus latus]